MLFDPSPSLFGVEFSKAYFENSKNMLYSQFCDGVSDDVRAAFPVDMASCVVMHESIDYYGQTCGIRAAETPETMFLSRLISGAWFGDDNTWIGTGDIEKDLRECLSRGADGVNLKTTIVAPPVLVKDMTGRNVVTSGRLAATLDIEGKPVSPQGERDWYIIVGWPFRVFMKIPEQNISRYLTSMRLCSVTGSCFWGYWFEKEGHRLTTRVSLDIACLDRMRVFRITGK